ncbi:nucleoside-diphosphate sugar epimerase/dehydratase [Sphingomonas sp. SORGH_AS_0879]|uniref:polysaccharide biosynthesis protein n=1 Tax=Sphingomonas sp. SORGH_AS_0879 TaxID=3041790 RepID=UPI00277ED6EF|nr:nucleoside-diphosphate sugar epimerase/dehydratase [Sphingomonas sp. SORGH_AS_0879]MDQ1228589.1 FlaA1/EpsC-like NDP-sugar epimerase [Sphingomonas sp. SORGH_AS_0879]
MSFLKTHSIATPLLALPPTSKRLILIGVDAALCALAVWLALYLRLGEWVSLTGRPSIAVVLSLTLALPIFWILGVYRAVLRHLSTQTLITCAVACMAYGLTYSAIITAYAFDDIPRTVGIIQPLLLFLGVTFSRSLAGLLLSGRLTGSRNRQRDAAMALIYGAGSSGQQLAMAMADSREMRIVGFLDDDQSLHGRRLRGLPVMDPAELADAINRWQITDILLALPSVSRGRRNEVIAALRRFPISIRTLPGLMDLAHGKVHASDLRELTIEDLLAREAVDPDEALVASTLRGRTILVTGAGGSIGSELCRQIMRGLPARLLLFEANEFALYNIHRELEPHASDNGIELVPLLGSVVDRARVATVFETWTPYMVFHAAAYKHVPLVEHNVLEGLRNNVIGTRVVTEAAVRCGVHHFVLVSTDKAVRPTNIMGATKRWAEQILQGLQASGASTCFSMVRFGNVLGSSGSVVPLFREQVRNGGPLTITHRDITRFFMTIPEAAQLVIQAGAMARGGEVFVLDMGEPVRIIDLARNVIELSGFTVRDEDNPHGDIEIKVVGMRPGEKLYEELLIGNDPVASAHPRILMASEPFEAWERLRAHLDRLEELIAANDVVATKALLGQVVPEFASVSDIVDWTHLAATLRRSNALPQHTSLAGVLS